MGNIWSGSSSSIGFTPRREDLIPAGDDGITESEGEGTVHLYVVFVKGDGDSLDINAEVEKLQNVLPANVTFKVKRIDETGHAAVIETDAALTDRISAAENVENVIVDTPAKLTGEDSLVKKNEEELLPEENLPASIVESDSENAIDNALGLEDDNEVVSGETATILLEDSSVDVPKTSMGLGALIIGAVLIIVIAVIVLFTKKRK